MPRTPIWSAGLLAGLLAWPTLAAAQAPSPLELARGLREQGMPDLGLEYLKELEAKPNLAPGVRSEIPLERAQCQIEAADEETDDAIRTGLMAEAKEGLTGFLKAHKAHPRAAEAALALARLTSLEAKSLLGRARRLEPKPGENAEDAGKRQKVEAAKARKPFQVAAQEFKNAAEKLATQIKALPPNSPQRASLEQQRIDAQLSAGINQFALADTFLNPDADELKERTTQLDKAQELFNEVVSAKPDGRAAWVARAWMGEIEFEKGTRNVGIKQFEEILRTPGIQATDGKRMVQFFQLRRAFLDAGEKGTGYTGPQALAESWLRKYGNLRRARTEAIATRWYYALCLEFQARGSLTKPKDPKAPPPTVRPGSTAERQLKAAERIFRELSQTDNDYTSRATRRRMQIVRLLLGEADKPAAAYTGFEDCQMAALIQFSKLLDAERDEKTNEADLKKRRQRIVELLERARALAPDTREAQNDVAEVIVRLIYFYQVTDQPHKAAILGEYLAHSGRTANRAAQAGSMAMTGYNLATSRAPAGVGIEDIRKTDRERSIRLGRFLEKTFPNESATNQVRHRLGEMLEQDGDLVGAFDVLTRITAAYERVAGARIMEAKLAIQLLASKDSPLPNNRKLEVFNRVIADLDKVPRPPAGAAMRELRIYVTARYQLARLLFLESRVNPKANPITGSARAFQTAETTLKEISTFTGVVPLDKWEFRLLIEDIRTQAVLNESRHLLEQGKFDEAIKAIQPLLDELKTGPYFGQVAGLAAEGEAAVAQKGTVERYAQDVDAKRRELIVVGLKTRVKQGAIDQATGLIDQLKAFSKSKTIEENVPVLQQLALELTKQIETLRAEGRTNPAKVAEAQALTDGFARFLKVVSAEPTLPPAMLLFIGRSLVVVHEFDEAITTLQKVPRPADKLLFDPITKVPEEQKPHVFRYKASMLYLCEALRQAGTAETDPAKKTLRYNQAAAELDKVIGTPAQKGWGFYQMEFRKEKCYLNEARGTDEAPGTPKVREHFLAAMNEWQTIFRSAQARVQEVQKNPPKDANGNPDNAAIQRAKNGFYDAYLDVQRCLVKANLLLQAKNLKALRGTIDEVAKGFVEMEKLHGASMNADVRNRYVELLADVKFKDEQGRDVSMMQVYKDAGGTLFLSRAD